MASAPRINVTQKRFGELHRTASNFTSCRLEFHGERNRNKVEEFINHLTCYKQIEQISDEDALMSFPLLMKDEAFVWWHSVSSEVKTWTNMLEKLKEKFIPRLEPYEVYSELFSKPQEENEDIYYFITRKRELLDLLPANRHTEEEQLDFCYGMLNDQMKKNTKRNEIKSFADLYEKGLIVQSEVEGQKAYEEIKRSVREEKETIFMQVVMNEFDSQNNNGGVTIDKRAGKKCSFCNRKGHLRTECRELRDHNKRAKVYCFGCGEPGVVRSQCTKC